MPLSSRQLRPFVVTVVLALVASAGVVLAPSQSAQASLRNSLGTTALQLPAYKVTGKLIADNGFRPQTNGFGFENYGDETPTGATVTNLTATELRRLFGDQVCVNPKAKVCTLGSQAKQWMEQANKGMNGGHCQGFSVLSGLFYRGQKAAKSFGNASVPKLKLDGNAALQRELAWAYAFQMVDGFNDAIITGTPSEILDNLISVLKKGSKESYTLGIYKEDFSGGHAVTPFAVEDQGEGIYQILIYDNNFPQTTRTIEIDTNEDTWSYQASTNPNEPSELYQGNASTKTIDLEPTTPGLGVQHCPFCGGRSNGNVRTAHTDASPGPDTTSTLETMLIYLDASQNNHGHLLITDAMGNRLGYDHDGVFHRDIPGARAVFPKQGANPPKKSVSSWKFAPEPDYYVPESRAYTITLDGRKLTKTDVSSVGIIGPTYDLYVDDINLRKGEIVTLKVGDEVEDVDFVSNDRQRPAFEVSFADEADYTLYLDGLGILAGKRHLYIELPTSGEMIINNAPGNKVNFGVERIDDDQDIEFFHEKVGYKDGDELNFVYGEWQDEDDQLALEATNAKGVTTVTMLDNQA